MDWLSVDLGESVEGGDKYTFATLLPRGRRLTSSAADDMGMGMAFPAEN